MALFSIDGNHVGYENQLDLPNRINFDGSFVKFGPFQVSLAPLDGALAALINVVNKTIVPGIEFLQYRSYNAVTSRILVRKAALKACHAVDLACVGLGDAIWGTIVLQLSLCPEQSVQGAASHLLQAAAAQQPFP